MYWALPAFVLAILPCTSSIPGRQGDFGEGKGEQTVT